MYGKYVLKRAGYGILMYVIMIFVYSTLFNSVADRTMSSLIDEQVAQEMTRYKSLDEAQRAGLREERELGGMGLGASQGLGDSAAFGDDGEDL